MVDWSGEQDVAYTAQPAPAASPAGRGSAGNAYSWSSPEGMAALGASPYEVPAFGTGARADAARDYFDIASTKTPDQFTPEDWATYSIAYAPKGTEWDVESIEFKVLSKYMKRDQYGRLARIAEIAKKTGQDFTIAGVDINGNILYRLGSTTKSEYSKAQTLKEQGTPPIINPKDLSGYYILDAETNRVEYVGKGGVSYNKSGLPAGAGKHYQFGRGTYVTAIRTDTGEPLLSDKDLEVQYTLTQDYKDRLAGDMPANEKEIYRTMGLSEDEIKNLSAELQIKRQADRKAAGLEDQIKSDYTFAGEKGKYYFDKDENVIFESPTGKETVIGRIRDAVYFDPQTNRPIRGIEEGRVNEEGEWLTGRWDTEQLEDGTYVTTGEFTPGTYDESYKFKPEEEDTLLEGGGGFWVNALNTIRQPDLAAKALITMNAEGRDIDDLLAQYSEATRGIEFFKEAEEKGISPFVLATSNPRSWKEALDKMQTQLRTFPIAKLGEGMNKMYWSLIEQPFMLSIANHFNNSPIQWLPDDTDSVWVDYINRNHAAMKADPKAWELFKNSPAAYEGWKLGQIKKMVPEYEANYREWAEMAPMYSPSNQNYVEMLSTKTVDQVMAEYQRDHPMESMMYTIFTETLYSPYNYLMFMNAPIKAIQFVPKAFQQVGKMGKIVSPLVERGGRTGRVAEGVVKLIDEAKGIGAITTQSMTKLEKVKGGIRSLAKELAPTERALADDLLKNIDEVLDSARAGTPAVEAHWGIALGKPFSPIRDLARYGALKKWFEFVDPKVYKAIGTAEEAAQTILSDLPIYNVPWIKKIIDPLVKGAGMGTISRMGKMGRASMHSTAVQRVLMASLGKGNVDELEGIMRLFAYGDEASKVAKVGYLAQNKYGRATSDLMKDTLKLLEDEYVNATKWKSIKTQPIFDKDEWKLLTKAEQGKVLFFSEQERQQVAFDFIKDLTDKAAQKRYGVIPYLPWKQVRAQPSRWREAVDLTRVVNTVNRGLSSIFLSTPRFLIRNMANNMATAMVDGVQPFSMASVRNDFRARTGLLKYDVGYSPAETLMGRKDRLQWWNPLKLFQQLSAKGEAGFKDAITFKSSYSAMRQYGDGFMDLVPLPTELSNVQGTDVLAAQIRSIHKGGGSGKEMLALRNKEGLLTVDYFGVPYPDSVSPEVLNQMNSRLPHITTPEEFKTLQTGLRQGIINETNDYIERASVLSKLTDEKVDSVFETYNSLLNYGYDKDSAWTGALNTVWEKEEWEAIYTAQFSEFLDNVGLSQTKRDKLMKALADERQEIYHSKFNWGKNPDGSYKGTRTQDLVVNKTIHRDQYEVERAVANGEMMARQQAKGMEILKDEVSGVMTNKNLIDLLEGQWVPFEGIPVKDEVVTVIQRTKKGTYSYMGNYGAVKNGLVYPKTGGTWTVTNLKTNKQITSASELRKGIPLPGTRTNIPPRGTPEYQTWFSRLSPAKKLKEQKYTESLNVTWQKFKPTGELKINEVVDSAIAKRQESLNVIKWLRDVDDTAKDFFKFGKGRNTPPLGQMTTAQKQTLNKWIEQHAALDKTVKAISDDAGHAAADFALHDYSRTYDFDLGLKMLFPWEFWATRSARKWIQRTVERPWIMAGFARYREQLAKSEDLLIPERLKGKLKVYIPGLSLLLPEWTNGEVFVDPMKMFLPITDWTDTYVDKEMAETTIGKVMTFVNNSGLSTSPLITMGAALAGSLGDTKKGNWFPYTPPEEILMAITGGLSTLAGSPSLGIGREPQFWDYYMNRAKSGLVTNKEISAEAAEQAMQSREGTVWNKIEKLATEEYHLRRSVGVMTGFPAATFPEGERKHFERVPEKLEAQYKYKTGVDPLAMKDFYEKYPDEKTWTYNFLSDKDRVTQVEYNQKSTEAMQLIKDADQKYRAGDISIDKRDDEYRNAGKMRADAYEKLAKSIKISDSDKIYIRAAQRLSEINLEKYFTGTGKDKHWDEDARQKARDSFLSTLNPDVAQMALIYEQRNKTDYQVINDAANIQISGIYKQMDELKDVSSKSWDRAKQLVGKNGDTKIAELLDNIDNTSNTIWYFTAQLEKEDDPKTIRAMRGKLDNALSQLEMYIALADSFGNSTDPWARHMMASIAVDRAYAQVNTLKVFPERLQIK